MRAAAEVQPVALAIDADRLACGDLGDDLGLVVLADAFEVGNRRVALPDLADDGLVALDDLAHPRLDPLQVLRREGLGPGEVVVEAVVDGGADGHLGVRVKLLNRFGHDMGGVMAEQLHRRGILRRQDRHPRVVIDGRGEVAKLPVHPNGQRRLGQAGADVGGDLGAGRRMVVASGTAVRKGDPHGVNPRDARRRDDGGGRLLAVVHRAQFVLKAGVGVQAI